MREREESVAIKEMTLIDEKETNRRIKKVEWKNIWIGIIFFITG
ncbi:unnamed protein product, partial [marine sediment metagenome]